ncbi:MAG: hypothetical protein LZF86_110949 [Nitrospira sp.]|nr:MAG: hypothetical protein LZF86_110949 [Nitrospira sp.]
MSVKSWEVPSAPLNLRDNSFYLFVIEVRLSMFRNILSITHTVSPGDEQSLQHLPPRNEYAVS